MNAFQITPPMGYCTFYNISVKELEDPEFPFVCERMNTRVNVRRSAGTMR